VTQASPRVAFIGVGAMGEPMAANLLKKGFSVATIEHRRPEPVARLRQLGARVASTPADAMRGCDIALTCLPTGKEVEAVVLGAEGLAAGAKAGSVIVDCTTSDPATTVGIGAVLRSRGIGFVDAGLTRARQGAIDGKLAFFLGGEAADVARVRPALEAMGDTFFHFGRVGSGHRAKIISNMVALAAIAITNEAFALGSEQGLDVRVLYDALMAGNGRSRSLEVYGLPMVVRDYAAKQFSIAHACHDLLAAQKLADECGVAVPVVTATQRVFEEAASSMPSKDSVITLAREWHRRADARRAVGEKTK
jgi:3-hydroxyisobutyrate dehydrogenase-like beta-hydroxyacid dehydrogenase